MLKLSPGMARGMRGVNSSCLNRELYTKICGQRSCSDLISRAPASWIGDLAGERSCDKRRLGMLRIITVEQLAIVVRRGNMAINNRDNS